MANAHLSFDVPVRRGSLVGGAVLMAFVLWQQSVLAGGGLVEVTHQIENGTLWVGTNQLWGSAIVGLRYQNRPTWVDNGVPDAGRQIQIDLQNDLNPNCFPCNQSSCNWGWNAVQSGNACELRSGSLILDYVCDSQTGFCSRLHTNTQPYQWNSLYQPPRANVEEVQDIRLLPNRARVAQIDYTIINHETFPVSTRPNALPVVFLTPALDRAFTYDGPNPWTFAGPRQLNLALPPQGPVNNTEAVQVMFLNTERWGAWIGADGVGLALYSPSQGGVPSGAENQWFLFERSNPPGTSQTNVLSNVITRTLAPNESMTHRVYLIAGTLDEIRKEIYEMEGHPATVTASAANVTEGNGGTTQLNFPVSLNSPWPVPVTVNYNTANGTANAGPDYVAASGTLTFAPWQTPKQIVVTVNNDSLNEANETLSLQLTAPNGGVIGGSGAATGTIVNDDPLPNLSISGALLAEGTGGSVALNLTANLSTASGQQLTAQFATSNNTAVSGEDYTAASGTITFAAGTTSRSITVNMVGDSKDEFDESFNVNLSNYGAITVGSATGTIQDDDPPPSISIGDLAAIAEGNVGQAVVNFPVSLSSISGKPIVVNFATANGSAVASSDYVSASGSVSFPPDTLSRTASVSIIGDPNVEPSETFSVDLTILPTSNVTAADLLGVGTIPPDADASQISVQDVSVTETDGPGVNATFTVALSALNYQPVTVSYSLTDGTAANPADYTAVGGILTFAPNTLTRTFTVPIQGDQTDEYDETFNASLGNPSPASAPISDGQGLGTIVDNDPLPTIRIDDGNGVEGDCGYQNVSATIVLTPASGKNVWFAFQTADGTARAGEDYVSYPPVSSGFFPGQTSALFGTSIMSDRLDESDEYVRGQLVNVAEATVVDGEAQLTILDDDTAPGVTGDELSHGSDELRTLAVAGGADWFTIMQRARSSFEIVVEGVSGDVASPASPIRLDLASCNQTEFTPSVAVDGGQSRSLRWDAGLSPSDVFDRLIRVSSGCTTSCAGNGRYRVRAFDTTYSLSRFNNSGGQYTVVMIQNPTTYTAPLTVHFWSEAGVLLNSSPYFLAPRTSLVLDTTTLVPGVSGSITVSNSARYGDLTGKAVTMDPTSHIEFETPMSPKAH